MCGRYALWDGKLELDWLFNLKIEESLKPRYNIAPSEEIPIVRQNEAGERELAFVRWGLIPPWTRDPSQLRLSLFNARAETVADKPSFRSAFRKRRCLIPASGFYEWQTQEDGKQPWFIKGKDRQPLALAGLWEKWGSGGEQIESCTIITVDADTLLQPIHHRMPAIIPPEHFAAWLDPDENDRDLLEHLLIPAPSAELEAFPVSRNVNSARNDGPELVTPLA